ncbi:hypothetical protein LTR84_001679 [Exophiala bonariae]|uniref:Uncharacterized protein n=1 Tax=Exophiala bonariae TaxID=1690606 RepID=A0AAV9NB58_9EURO|nr:hypothetical protein LTR84_001679 [Exophiala bonariae]
MSTLACHGDPEITSDPVLSRPVLNFSGALSSHTPLYFAALPAARSTMTPPAASRLLYISSWKHNSETAKDEPRLRKLLGHISVYDKTRTFTHNASNASSQDCGSETSAYAGYQVPSFKAFQAAIQDQLAAMAKSSTAESLRHTNDDGFEQDEDDSDYDSYDGDDWSDEDDSEDSDESFTDNESTEGQWSECTSPISPPCDEDGEADLWAIRPPTVVTTGTHLHPPYRTPVG